MNKIKYAISALAIMTLSGCGDSFTFVDKNSKAVEVERATVGISQDQAKQLKGFNEEVSKLDGLVVQNLYGKENHPSVEKTPTSFKYGDGDKITEAYTTFLTKFEKYKKEAETDYTLKIKSFQDNYDAKLKDKADFDVFYNEYKEKASVMQEKFKLNDEEEAKSKAIVITIQKQLSDAFNASVARLGLNIDKTTELDFDRLGTSENTCKNSDLSSEKFVAIPYQEGYCTKIYYPRMNSDLLNPLITDADFVKEQREIGTRLTEARITAGLMKPRNIEIVNFRTKKVELNNEFNEIKQKFAEDAGTSFRQVRNKVSKLEREVKNAKRTLDGVNNGKASDLVRYISSHYKDLNADVLAYNNAVKEYRTTFLDENIDDIDFNSGFESNKIEITHDEDKPLLLVMDREVGNKKTMIYYFYTTKLKEAVEAKGLEGDIELKLILSSGTAKSKRTFSKDLKKEVFMAGLTLK